MNVNLSPRASAFLARHSSKRCPLDETIIAEAFHSHHYPDYECFRETILKFGSMAYNSLVSGWQYYPDAATDKPEGFGCSIHQLGSFFEYHESMTWFNFAEELNQRELYWLDEKGAVYWHPSKDCYVAKTPEKLIEIDSIIGQVLEWKKDWFFVTEFFEWVPLSNLTQCFSVEPDAWSFDEFQIAWVIDEVIVAAHRCYELESSRGILRAYGKSRALLRQTVEKVSGQVGLTNCPIFFGPEYYPQ